MLLLMMFSLKSQATVIVQAVGQVEAPQVPAQAWRKKKDQCQSFGQLSK